MCDTLRLSGSFNFQNVYRSGRVVYNKFIILHVLNRKDGKGNRVGFVVKKRIGSATVRNRVKRLMREGYRANEERVKRPHDLIFVAKQSLKEKSYVEVKSALERVLEKAHLLEDK